MSVCYHIYRLNLPIEYFFSLFSMFTIQLKITTVLNAMCNRCRHMSVEIHFIAYLILKQV